MQCTGRAEPTYVPAPYQAHICLAQEITSRERRKRSQVCYHGTYLDSMLDALLYDGLYRVWVGLTDKAPPLPGPGDANYDFSCNKLHHGCHLIFPRAPRYASVAR